MDMHALGKKLRGRPGCGGRYWDEVGVALADAQQHDAEAFNEILVPAIEAAAIPDPLPLSSIPAVLAWASVHNKLKFSAGVGRDVSCAELVRLLDSPAAPRVVALSLVSPTDERLVALAEHPGLAHITQLAFTQGREVAQGWTALSESPHLNVEALQFLEVTSQGLPQLVTTAAPRLTFLRLERADLDANATRRMLQAPFPKLGSLHVTRNAIGDEGIGAVGNAAAPALEDLVICNTKMTAAGLTALAGSTLLDTVNDLTIDGFSDSKAPAAAGIESLVAHPRMKLKHLFASKASIGDDALRAIAGAAWPLETLELAGNIIFDPTPLTNASWIGNLRDFSIGVSSLSEAGLQALVQSDLAQPLKRRVVEEFEQERGYLPARLKG